VKPISIAKKFLFRSAFLVIVVMCLELFTQLALVLSPKLDVMISKVPRTPHMLSDPILGTIPNPQFPGHDAWGFRNREVPASVDIVGMGDSQTYGTGIAHQFNWPSQLASKSHQSIYNMSWGGYGPVHYYHLLNRALTLHPKVIVVAYYFGNDLYDAYEMIYVRKQCTDLLDSKAEADITETRVSLGGPGASGEIDFSLTSLPQFLWAHSRLLGLVRPLKDIVHLDEWNFWIQTNWFNNRELVFVEHGSVRTSFDVLARLPGLDDRLPHITQGFDLTLAAINRMNAITKQKGVHLLVAVIPTKESVFSPYLRDHSQANEWAFQRIVASEGHFEKRLQQFLHEQRIPAFFAKRQLQQLIENGTSPYRVSVDGHLNRFGQQVIAEGIAPLQEIAPP
jgi:hypothetical protein